MSYPLIRAKNYSPTQSRAIGWIVLHTAETDCRPGVALAIAKWFAGSNAPLASAHFCVDPNITIQCVRVNDTAWHCGSPGNKATVGIELAGRASFNQASWDSGPAVSMLHRAAKLVAELCAQLNIEPAYRNADAIKAGVGGLTGHNDIRLALGGTNHTDPGKSFPWPDFVAMVVSELTPPEG